MLETLPVEAVLRDGKTALLRPFAAADTEALFEFFQRLPIDVKRFAWDDLRDHSLVEAWGRNIDYAKVLPILAVHDQKIVADATLHRRRGGPLRLVGRIKWLMDPEYRGVGLGTTLVNTFIAIARSQRLRHLSCMLIADLEADAIQTLEELGFDSTTVPGYGTDADGAAHDMVKLILKL